MRKFNLDIGRQETVFLDNLVHDKLESPVGQPLSHKAGSTDVIMLDQQDAHPAESSLDPNDSSCSGWNIPRCVGFSRCTWHAMRAQRQRAKYSSAGCRWDHLDAIVRIQTNAGHQQRGTGW